jgi:hypothetical protein
MSLRSSIQRARELSNCIIWAFLLRRRLSRKGHRIYKMKRKSDWGSFSHHLVGIGRPGRNGQEERVRVVSYKPISPRKRLVPPPLFAGKAVWGDVRKKLPSQ